MPPFLVIMVLTYSLDAKNNGRRKKGMRDFSYENPFRPEFMYEILPKIKSHLSIQVILVMDV